MALKDYVPVMTRLKQFREDNKDRKVLIETGYQVSWEKEAVIFKCQITIDGEVKAVGHAMAPSLGEDKEFEKAETTAVGRALAFLGYEADDGASSDNDDADEDDNKKSSKGKSKKGLGRGLGSKKSKKDEDEEEEDEDESDDSDESEDEESEDEEESDDDDSEEEDEKEEKSEKKEEKKSGASSLNNIMAKYGLDKNKKKE